MIAVGELEIGPAVRVQESVSRLEGAARGPAAKAVVAELVPATKDLIAYAVSSRDEVRELRSKVAKLNGDLLAAQMRVERLEGTVDVMLDHVCLLNKGCKV